MSGHNKWSTIKHKKAASDAKRGKIFSKIARELMIAARDGGGDPNANVTLRGLIQKARGVNMPADNVDRAIKKGAGELGGEALEEVFYEGYAPGGVAILVGVLTDNRNRSASDVRHIFTRNNAKLEGSGSVQRQFQRRGVVLVDAADAGEDRVLEIVLEAGADDLERDEDQFRILTAPNAFQAVVEALEQAGLPPSSSELTLLPETTTLISDREAAAALLRFIEALEDLDDVQNVYGNFEIEPDVLQALTE